MMTKGGKTYVHMSHDSEDIIGAKGKRIRIKKFTHYTICNKCNLDKSGIFSLSLLLQNKIELFFLTVLFQSFLFFCFGSRTHISQCFLNRSFSMDFFQVSSSSLYRFLTELRCFYNSCFYSK